jgi:hypothetical protein
MKASNEATDLSDLKEERKQTDLIRNRGMEGGLFRASMDKIRKSHHYGQLLRQAFIVMGLFSDKDCYSELLTQFYVTTKALEKLVHEKELACVKKVASYYRFTELYEEDLKYLLGDDQWERVVEGELISEAAREYIALIEKECGTGDKADREAAIIAGIVILWGPLIIGGGAALYPKIKRAYGIEATHVLRPIIGAGREQRRNDFITCIDAIASKDGYHEDQQRFDRIVECVGRFMEYNNRIMVAVKRQPSWLNYVYTGAAVAVIAAVAVYVHSAEFGTF